LSALYENLITPIEAELNQVKVIAFIPNELLFYLPMQALVKNGTNGEMHYLIEDKQIVYLTTADVMNVVQLPDEEKSHQGMVAFGNPTGAELPSAEVEVEAIAKFFPETECLIRSSGDQGSAQRRAAARQEGRSLCDPRAPECHATLRELYTARFRRNARAGTPDPGRSLRAAVQQSGSGHPVGLRNRVR
jgi:hypothetical protein